MEPLVLYKGIPIESKGKIVKLVSYNIRFGVGLDQKIDLERIADTVKDADIIALRTLNGLFASSFFGLKP